MILARQLHRRGRPLAALHNADKVLSADGHGAGKEFAIAEAAARSNGRVLAADEMGQLLGALSVELRLVAADRLELLFKGVANVNDKAAMPLALLGIEREWDIDKVRHAIRRQTG